MSVRGEQETQDYLTENKLPFVRAKDRDMSYCTLTQDATRPSKKR